MGRYELMICLLKSSIAKLISISADDTIEGSKYSPLSSTLENLYGETIGDYFLQASEQIHCLQILTTHDEDCEIRQQESSNNHNGGGSLYAYPFKDFKKIMQRVMKDKLSTTSRSHQL